MLSDIEVTDLSSVVMEEDVSGFDVSVDDVCLMQFI